MRRFGPPLVDVHVHAAEYDESDWADVESLGAVYIVAVSSDAEESKKVVELAEGRERVVPCVGVHPWSAGRCSDSDVAAVEKLLSSMERPCLGEVGLDLKFVPETFERQREVLDKLLAAAADYGAVVNLHAAGAWRQALEALRKHDVERAIFHWYTGPFDVLEELLEEGYYVSANAAAKIQEKHREVVKAVPLSKLLTESDGPYNYRGLRLSTKMLPELVELIAELKKASASDVAETVWSNFRRLFEL